MSDCKDGGRCVYSKSIAAAIREERIAQLEAKVRYLSELDANERVPQIHALIAERDELRRDHDIQVARSARRQKRVMELQEELDDMTVERDYWRDQVIACLECATRPHGFSAGVIGYPRDVRFTSPSTLVTDEICSLRDFYAEAVGEEVGHGGDDSEA